MPTLTKTWQGIQAELLARIHDRRWQPGELVPNEADLAIEFGCSRATVNRAMRSLAENGFLDRKRKAGTRVSRHPVRKATMDIPIIRHQVEARNQAYGYTLIAQTMQTPPQTIRARLGLTTTTQEALHVMALHLADGHPYVLEDRWLNAQALPEITGVDFSTQSANEWLVLNAMFSRGDIAFSATPATADNAALLSATPGDALFMIERRTWSTTVVITTVRLTFGPGFRMHTEI